MKEHSSKIVGIHRINAPKNNNITAIFVVYFNPMIGSDNIYAAIGAAGRKQIGLY